MSEQTNIQCFVAQLELLIPQYASNAADAFAEGNVAVCIIDEEGNMFGKIWGTNKAKGRQFARLAWVKASQVWLTGMKTGEFERKLFNGELNEEDFGIQAPDLIGWEGGQPLVLKDGTRWSVGFSGFRGFNDLAIAEKALAMIELVN